MRPSDDATKRRCDQATMRPCDQATMRPSDDATMRPSDQKKRFHADFLLFDNGRREKFECELISSSISRQSNRARGFGAKAPERSRTSAKGRTVDALASQGDEGRGKLRKASGSGKHALIRGFPNGAIRRPKRPSPPDEFIVRRGETRGSETSQYPQEKKTNSDCASSGERTRSSPNQGACSLGLRDRAVGSALGRGTAWKGRRYRVIAPYPKPSPALAASQVGRDT